MDNERQQRYFDLGENYCWLRGKYDFVRTFLSWYVTHPPDQARVLDLGCGPGNMNSTLSEFGTVYGTDFSLEALRFGRGRGLRRLFIGDLSDFPIESGQFDLAVMIDVLEHIRDDRRALAELFRVMKPGGVAVLTVPAFQMLWGSHDRIYGHFRRYTRAGLVGLMEAAGFQVETSTYFETLFFLPMWVFRRLRGAFEATKDRDDFIPLPTIVNAVVRRVISWEAYLVRYWHPPLGVTLIAVARKPK